ncbi:MAG: hypothetical protein EPO26_16490 [Chloroflexota bacterium]|nr:MAG: hypothetical protein EPO26_16490 [Chloroflexota bacterium]
MAAVSARLESRPGEVLTLLRAALTLFIITIVIGLINGQQSVQFDRGTLITHLHSGTLGWISLSVFAATIWLFSAGNDDDAQRRWISRFGVAAVSLYVILFYVAFPGRPLGSPALLAVGGTLAMLSMIWLWVWTVRQSRRISMGVARLALLGAVTNMCLGAILGVTVEARMMGAALAESFQSAHPAMMVVGYLIPAGMALIEWRFKGLDAPRSLWGTVQVAAPVVGGWCVILGLLLGILPLVMLSLVLEIVAIVIFVVRMARPVLALDWMGGIDRHIGIASVALVISVVLFVYLIFSYVEDFSKAPRGLILGTDHMTFLGVLTNAILVMAYQATARRATVWPWSDQVQFWGINIGWIGFVAALLTDTKALIPIFTPILGVCLLIAIATYANRSTGESQTAS